MILALAAAFAPPAFAQTASVSGQVTDQNGVPIVGARVVIAQTAIPIFGFLGEIQKSTDSSGLFVFDELGAARWRVTVTADGFEPVEQTIETEPGRLTEANFKLAPKAVAATRPPISVIVSAGVGRSRFPSFASRACDTFRVDLPFDDQCSSATTGRAFNVGASLLWNPSNNSWLGLRGGAFFGTDGRLSYENVATAGTVAAGNQQQVFNRATADLSYVGLRLGPNVTTGRLAVWPYYSFERTHVDGVLADERQRLGVTDLAHSADFESRSRSSAVGVYVGWDLFRFRTVGIGVDVSVKKLKDVVPQANPPNHARAPAEFQGTRVLVTAEWKKPLF
ncbi:MAG: carboxypeptidase-like regulatory domain-containing protein [Vicinamibacterales bacterium]